jgi:hypothetical protein
MVLDRKAGEILVSKSTHATTTKYHKLRWFINNKHLFLTVLEAGKSKIKASTNRCLVRTVSWFLLSISLHGQRGEGVSGSLFHKGTNLNVGTESS